MDRVTLDFENNTVEWNTDHQKGTEMCPDLHERKKQIFAAMGYSEFDISAEINAMNALINGKITPEEYKKIMDSK